MSSIGDPVQFVESRFGIQMKRAGRTPAEAGMELIDAAMV